MKAIFFESDSSLASFIQSSDYKNVEQNRIDCGINFLFTNQSNIEYTIRLNVSEETGILKTSSIPPVRQYVVSDLKSAESYIRSGFTNLQLLIDTFILNELAAQKGITKKNRDFIKPLLTSMKIPAYTQDNLADRLKETGQVFVVFPWIVVFLRFLYKLLYEKVKEKIDKFFFL
jgi:hypothetical protein